ncbi:uncharacterized protein PAC_19754 [Phialocephala subalpina]|uniref:Heterokaryon incompatibility domain-containing protein n=1 Tax=Phialocephala subalpina TaxID=576137 RepID=A0A1L7XXX8_9HELO|nr:uncharacterized protein PAC_19754 [Phialocephala subalpina]
MATIYQRAKSAIVWLGPGDEQSNRAVQIICDHETQKFPQLPVSNLIALASFFDIRELVFAKAIRLLCGDQSIPWSALDIFYRHEPSWNLRNDIDGIDGVEDGDDLHLFPLCIFKKISKNQVHPSSTGDLISSRLHHSGRAHYSLLATITVFSGNECQDPRDRVYRLLRIVILEHRISIDYGKDVARIFIDVVERLVDLEIDTGSTAFNLISVHKPAAYKDTCLQLGKLGDLMGLLKTNEEVEALAQYVVWKIEQNLSSEGEDDSEGNISCS